MGRKRCCPEDLPLRSIPPTPCGVGPARLRPRVARVLQDNTAYDPSTSDPSLPRLAAWAPPAYGRGWPGSFRTTPLATQAHPIHPSHALRHRSLPLTAAGGQGPQDNTACAPSTSAPSLPRLAAWAPPAYGRGWPGSFRTTPLAPCIHRAPSPAYRATLRFTLRTAKSFFDFWPPLSHCFNQCRSGIKDVPLEVLYAPTCASLASWPQPWPCPCSWHHIQGTCQSRRSLRCGS